MQAERPKLPNEAIELYNSFIHGEISRRDFLEGVKRFAIGGLATTAIVEALMPNYAQAQQVSKTDDRIKTVYMTVPSPQGNGTIKGYLVRPVSADTRTGKVEKLPGVIVVHENRGLNPHIEDIARRMALAGFMAFAPDGLTSLGGFPGDDYAGGQLFSKIDRGKMTGDMVHMTRGVRGDRGTRLHRAGPRADHGDALAVQVDVVVPAGGMKDRTPEQRQAGYRRYGRPVELPDRADHCIRLDGLGQAIREAERHLPASSLVVEFRCRDLCPEANVLSKIVFVGRRADAV